MWQRRYAMPCSIWLTAENDRKGCALHGFSNLTLVDAETNNTPAIAEYPLTLECKVLYTQKQDLSLIPEDIRKSDYPQDVDGTNPLANRDPHTAYIGKIVNAYMLR